MPEAQKPYGDLKIKKKDAEAHIEGEAAWETLNAHREEILGEMRLDFEAPGFRKGHVPKEVFMKYVREDSVLEDAAERTLQEIYPLILEDEKLEVLGRPEVAITKLAAGNPLGFRIRVGLVPEVKLPDYKKIAKEVIDREPKLEVPAEEVEKVIDELRQLRGKKDEPAELTDEFVKSLGEFADVADFRTKLAANIKLEKEMGRQRDLREKIAAALGEKTKMELPAAILDAETEAMQQKLEEDLKRANIKLEDYLAKLKKTMEELRAEHRGYVERQLKTRFILDAIAKAENIEADPQELAAEVRHLREHHPDNDPESLLRYADAMLRNEKVLRFLEGSEPEAPAKQS